MNDTTEFLILRHTDYKESDLILGGVSPYGQVSFIGKGLKKTTSKNAHACRLFSCSLMQYDKKEDRTIHLMKTASLIDSYRALREDLDLQILASLIAEIAMKIHDGNDLYAMVRKAFDLLKTKEKPFLVTASFLSDVLKREGNQPMTDMCVRCGSTKNIVAYSMEEGGFICRDCYNVKPALLLDVPTLKNLRILVKGTMDQIEYMPEELDKPAVTRLFLESVVYHTGIRLTSMDFFVSWYPETLG